MLKFIIYFALLEQMVFIELCWLDEKWFLIGGETVERKFAKQLFTTDFFMGILQQQIKYTSTLILEIDDVRLIAVGIV